MTGLALWLAVVALLDLRPAGPRWHRPRALAAAGVLALGVLVVLALAADPRGVGWAAWAVALAGLVGWVVGAADGWSAGATVAPIRPAWPARLAFGSVGVVVLAFVLAGPRAGDAGFLDHLVASSALGPDVGADRVVLVAGVLLAQFGTANLLVRLLLERLGVPAPDHEKRLRGGRFLGPMERLLIVGLALAGNLEGAAVVVAAKALLRFPEVREASRGAAGGASDVTEYFLVGSLASWIVAFGGIALCAV